MIKKGAINIPYHLMSGHHSHAMLPTPFHLYGSIYKIYFAGRNSSNQSSIYHCTVDITDPTTVLEYSELPVLKPGRIGTFDDNGVLPSCAIRVGDDIYLYTIGFKPGGTTRMDLFGGLAISTDDGKTFERWSEAPIIERSRVNPFINTAPWVIKSNDRFLMYYVSGVSWIHPDLPRYNIQIADSTDESLGIVLVLLLSIFLK